MSRRPLAVLISFALLAACGKKPEASGPRVVVVPPAENLSGDPTLDWLQTAIPAVLVSQLEAVPQMSVQRVERYPDANGVKNRETLFCRFHKAGDRLSVDCLAEPDTTIRASGPLGSVASWIGSLAKSVNAQAAAAPSVSNAALQALSERRYEDAIAAAPGFGLAYSEGAAFALAQGDKARAARIGDLAKSQGGALPPLARAKLDLTLAALSNDRAAQLAALQAIDKLAPPDESRTMAMAALLQQLKRLPEAAKMQQRIAETHPERPEVWNQLGYLRLWAGDSAGAIQALERYRALVPDQPNPIDSLGEAHYYSGKFAEAEKLFLECHSKSPQFNGGLALFKAAMARLSGGDAAGAGKFAADYAKGRGEDGPAIEANWLYATGNSAEAKKRLAGLAGAASGERAVRLLTQLAFWSAVDRQWPEANAYLMRAAATPASNPARFELAMVSIVASPPMGVAALQDRALRTLPGEALSVVRNSSLALGLLVRGEAAAAIPVARELRRVLPPADRFSTIVLASALRATGEGQQAGELLTVYPVPAALASTPFDSWLIEEERRLREKR